MKYKNYRTLEGKEKIQGIYDAIINDWHSPNEKQEIETRHGKTFIIASGDISNPPMILLHGSGSSSYMWAADIKAYSKDYRVYAADIPGEAGKSDPVRYSWKDNSIVEWLDDIYLNLDITSAILAGCSIGGFTAAKYAVNRPDSVSALILLCGSGIYAAKTSFIFKAIFFSITGRWGLNKLERAIFQKPVHKEVRDLFKLMAGQFIPRMEQPPVFTDEELKNLTMPLFYLGGQKDVLINTDKSVERLQKVVPHSRGCLLPDEGHALTDTSSLVLEFLKTNTRQDT